MTDYFDRLPVPFTGELFLNYQCYFLKTATRLPLILSGQPAPDYLCLLSIFNNLLSLTDSPFPFTGELFLNYQCHYWYLLTVPLVGQPAPAYLFPLSIFNNLLSLTDSPFPFTGELFLNYQCHY